MAGADIHGCLTSNLVTANLVYCKEQAQQLANNHVHDWLFIGLLCLQHLKDSPCPSLSELSGREEASRPLSSDTSAAEDLLEGTEQLSSQADRLHEGMAGLLALKSTADSKAVAQVRSVCAHHRLRLRCACIGCSLELTTAAVLTNSANGRCACTHLLGVA